MVIAQSRHGHSVSVVVRSDRAHKRARRAEDLHSWAPLRSAGIDVEAVEFQRRWGRRRLNKVIKAGEFDVIHAHRDDALIAAHRCLQGEAPVLIAQRGTIRTPPEKVRAEFASPKTSAIIAVADAVRDSLSHAIPATASKIHVVYGSVDLDEFRPREPDTALRKELGIPETAALIGSLSAYRRAKGLDILIDALAVTMKSHENVHAIMLGQNVEEHIAPLAIERGIADQIHFVGHQTDIARWLSVMDMTVVAATDREGLSGVLRESLAMEVPVISTDCAGNGEIVRDRETGLLIPMNDVEALTRALDWAVDNAGEMKAMAARGRTWVEENCAPEIQRVRLEEIYRSAMSV